MKKLIDLLILTHKIMKLVLDDKKGTDEYWKLVNQLPLAYRNSYHRVMQWGVQLIIMCNTAKRAREGNYLTNFITNSSDVFTNF